MLTATTGLLKDIANLQEQNRIQYIPTSDMQRSINTLVRDGHHFLILEDLLVTAVMARDFSLEGFLYISSRDTVTLLSGGVEAVLATVSQPHCSVMFFTDGASTLSTVAKESDLRPGSASRERYAPGFIPRVSSQCKVFREEHDAQGYQWAPLSVSVWEVAAGGEDPNVTLTQLSHVVHKARRVRQVSWCVTVVVVSDDLAAFAQWSLKGRLVGPATRLLAVTNASLVNNADLSRTYSMMNAVMLVTEYYQKELRCGVYLHVPYSPRGAQALKVAFWTPHQGLALTSRLPLFPDKFSRFSYGLNLVVASEPYPAHQAVMVDDPKAPGGKRLTYSSPIATMLQYLAEGSNFTYTFVRSPDRQWGTLVKNGSWIGMMGMVSRAEVDIGLGLFGISEKSAEVVDFTWPVLVAYGRILGGRGRPVVDPWGFVFPLTPLVWAAILATLLVLPLTTFLLSSCVSIRTPFDCLDDIFNFLKLILQQGSV
nr:uncharacterized protein LOC123755122 [Procambarus clarkii]